MIMNQDTMQGQWTQLKGKVQEQWGKLTNDDLDVINGRSDQLAGRIQERYGIDREQAQQQIRAFEQENNLTTASRSQHNKTVD
jgi:uncharacterized protein YjbJ (UPF0337 family)